MTSGERVLWFIWNCWLDGEGSLCWNGEDWAVSLVGHCDPTRETPTVTYRYFRREGALHSTIRTIHLSLIDVMKKLERIQLSTSQHPSTHRMGIVAGENSWTSTSQAIPCHTNCLYIPNATAHETVSHPVQVLSKRAFQSEGAKEMLTCIPKMDEHPFATAKLWQFSCFHFV